MNRDELIDKLAMELGEWPKTLIGASIKSAIHANGRWVFFGDRSRIVFENLYPETVSERLYIGEKDWLQRRAELINKPSWDDAPEWARWLAQDKRGEWCFYPEKPERSGTMWVNDQPKTGIWVDVHCTGKLPNGHDWRETLEQRPAPCGASIDACTFNPCDSCDELMTEEEEEMPTEWDVTIKRSGERGNVKISDLARAMYGDPVKDSWRKLAEQNKRPGRSKYHREIKPGVFVDVYDVLSAWRVENPALQHLVKKALQPGGRGHKTLEQDMADIVASAKRAQEIES